MSLATFSRLWQKLYDKFGLEPEIPSSRPAQLLRYVLPITDADEQLCTFIVERFTSPTVVVSVETVFATVPTNERWTVYALRASASSGDRLVDQWAIRDPNTGFTAIIDTFAANTSYNLNYAGGYSLVIEPGWTIEFQSTSGGTTDGPYTMTIFHRTDLLSP